MNSSKVQVFSRGMSKVMTQHNGEQHSDEINWDTDYDGEKALVSLNINKDGKKMHQNLQLSNADIMKMFTMPSVNKPLENRLLQDFFPSTSLLRSQKQSRSKKNMKKRRSTRKKRSTKTMKRK